jgi:hypothetical protein
MLVVNELIKAGKDFDCCCCPAAITVFNEPYI